MKKIYLLLLFWSTQVTLSSQYPLMPMVAGYESEQRVSEDDCFCRSCNRTFFKRASSLSEDPIFMTVQHLLKTTCTKKIAHKVMKIIDPLFPKKTPNFSIAQTFCLYDLCEKLLERCDTIIANPYHNLAKAHSLGASHEQQNVSSNFQYVMLQSFQDVRHDSDKYIFLKLYRLLAKMQSNQSVFPPNFNFDIYKTTTTFDYLFEENQEDNNADNSCPKTEVNQESNTVITNQNKSHLQIYRTIFELAKHADKLDKKYKDCLTEQQLSQLQITEQTQK